MTLLQSGIFKFFTNLVTKYNYTFNINNSFNTLELILVVDSNNIISIYLQEKFNNLQLDYRICENNEFETILEHLSEIIGVDSNNISTIFNISDPDLFNNIENSISNIIKGIESDNLNKNDRMPTS